MKRYIKSSSEDYHIKLGSIPFDKFSDYYDVVVDNIGHGSHGFYTNPESYLYQLTNKGTWEFDNQIDLMDAIDAVQDQIDELQDSPDYDASGDMSEAEAQLWELYETYEKELNTARIAFDKNAKEFFNKHFKVIEPMLDERYPGWYYD